MPSAGAFCCVRARGKLKGQEDQHGTGGVQAEAEGRGN